MQRSTSDYAVNRAHYFGNDAAPCKDEECDIKTLQTFSNDDTVRDSSPIRHKASDSLHRLRFLVTDVMMKEAENKSLVQADARERNRFFRAPRIGSRRIRNRLVQKYGLCNISLVNVPKQRRKYFSDIFTTVIEVKWRWSLLFFAMSFLISWTFFFSLYYLIILSHGDFDHLDDANWNPCIMNANSKINIFLFSFTTQTTIGYGFRYPTAECPLVIVTMCLQFMIGVMCQTLMAGVIFAKLARPIKRAATILFSKNAVICMRDGKLCLLFRVGDMRKSSLAEAHVRLQMIKKCITYEGELLPFHQFDMDVGYDEGLDRVFVIWPITICHEIDENSPLYEVSKETLETSRFEIIAILEGVVESVGSTTQARTSYLPNEILWGKRFEKLVTYQRENGEYRIDFGKFHNVYDVDTPTCSAKELDEMRVAGLKPENAYQVVSSVGAESNGTTPKVSVHSKRGNNCMSIVAPKDTGSVQRVKIETDDEDEEYENTVTVDVGLKHKRSVIRSQSPDFSLRHKQSARRGPDLF
ncbi:Inward rectifier potassium channel irk-1 [Toxocara canis]|uniref:G protein-activated inward rectifier potassium channel 3 n=1 Tax=Toxocara canis TaxID=6265 RepID=A0A0B2UTH6_TOXCA|nr:Inward rectifier potassium channel irk-1 [Toxocara canis]